jgi:hypothetical protein
MSILTRGTDFATGNQVTAANLNALVDSATFQSTAADNDSTIVSNGKIIVKDLGIKTGKLENSTGTSDGVTTAKIATNAVTLAKMATQADQTVLGNVSGGAAVPSALPVVIGGTGDSGILFDNDDMLDNSDTAGGSATRGATQQSIKAYVDSAPNFTPSSYNSEESVTFPNGLIIKMGKTSNISADSSLAVSFSSAFPNAIVSIVVTKVGGINFGGSGEITVNTISTSGFTIANGADSSGTFYFMAIGR